eukprot:1031891-Amphidinium_carterae.1
MKKVGNLKKTEVMKSKTDLQGVHHFNGDNNELGTACGRYYRVCCMTITDQACPTSKTIACTPNFRV